MFADKLAQQLFDILTARQQRIVFAESCTAGLIAASCGRISGISEVLAGSAVVYQLETKTEWLHIGAEMLQQHGAVSEAVCRKMAEGVLQMTPHADVGVSITGHLGPGAPHEQDGTAWCGVAIRVNGRLEVSAEQLQLDGPDAISEASELTIRHRRQQQAVVLALSQTIQTLNQFARD